MWAVPEVDLRGADHVPDGDAAVLAACHHHAVAEPELKAEFNPIKLYLFE